jgi:hypothetical protein
METKKKKEKKFTFTYIEKETNVVARLLKYASTKLKVEGRKAGFVQHCSCL